MELNSQDYLAVQEADFSVDEHYRALTDTNTTDGAVVFFVGRMRDFNQGDTVTGMFLEHYPKMTEKALTGIINAARERFSISRCRLIHRVGQLQVEDQIVFVGITCQHREDAFASCQFIMDYLKTQAPFWKQETRTNGQRHWVESAAKDTQAAKRWQSS